MLKEGNCNKNLLDKLQDCEWLIFYLLDTVMTINVNKNNNGAFFRYGSVRSTSATCRDLTSAMNGTAPTRNIISVDGGGQTLYDL